MDFMCQTKGSGQAVRGGLFDYATSRVRSCSLRCTKPLGLLDILPGGGGGVWWQRTVASVIIK